jgi:hypothetical protein
MLTRRVEVPDALSSAVSDPTCQQILRAKLLRPLAPVWLSYRQEQGRGCLDVAHFLPSTRTSTAFQ